MADESYMEHQVKKNNIVIIQARMASTRLPGKVLKNFSNGMSILDLQLATLSKIFDKNSIFIATTTNASDDIIEDRYSSEFNIYRGSEDDVMSRFNHIAKITKADNIVRLASDNPFVFIEGISTLLKLHEKSQADYTTYKIEGQPSMLVPVGLFVEVVSAQALQKIDTLANSLEKEHVTFAIYNRLNNLFNVQLMDIKNIYPALNNKDYRFTVDTLEDFMMINKIISDLNIVNKIDLHTLDEILRYVKKNNLIKIMKSESYKIKNSKVYEK